MPVLRHTGLQKVEYLVRTQRNTVNKKKDFVHTLASSVCLSNMVECVDKSSVVSVIVFVPQLSELHYA
jgi:hypothetical protein